MILCEKSIRVPGLSAPSASRNPRQRRRTIIEVRSRLRELRENREKAPRRLKAAHDDCSEQEEEIAKLEGQLNECREKIKNIDVAEIAKKEIKLEELRKREHAINQDIGALNQNILRTERTQKDIVKQADQLISKSVEAQRFILRRNLAKVLKERLEIQLAEEEKSAKSIIRKYISDIMDTTSRKHFRVQMDDNFTVTLQNADGITMAKSEGENQLLGLAFTAALCMFAKLRKGASGGFLLPGTEAPLVLDSPFGKLDGTYKVATAEFMPRMAGQIILMVSQEQGSENVLSELREKIGKEYCLIVHNRSERGEKAEEFIDIGSEHIETTVYESSFEGIEIRGVS